MTLCPLRAYAPECVEGLKLVRNASILGQEPRMLRSRSFPCRCSEPAGRTSSTARRVRAIAKTPSVSAKSLSRRGSRSDADNFYHSPSHVLHYGNSELVSVHHSSPLACSAFAPYSGGRTILRSAWRVYSANYAQPRSRTHKRPAEALRLRLLSNFSIIHLWGSGPSVVHPGDIGSGKEGGSLKAPPHVSALF